MKQSPLQRKTPLKAKTPLRAKSGLITRVGIARRKAQSAKRVRDTGPSKSVVDLVLARDGHGCVRCGKSSGVRSVHHRRPRRAGGDRRPDTNSPANLITLCGSGVSGCHGWVEQHRAVAQLKGWLLSANDEPSAVVLDTWWGPVRIDHEGRWTRVEQCPACTCDPAVCANDDSGQHCEEQSCGSCLHGCPIEGGCPVCVARYAEAPS